MAGKVYPEVLINIGMRGRGSGRHHLQPPTILLEWPDGGMCRSEGGGQWEYFDPQKACWVVARDTEQELWSTIVGRKTIK